MNSNTDVLIADGPDCVGAFNRGAAQINHGPSQTHQFAESPQRSLGRIALPFDHRPASDPDHSELLAEWQGSSTPTIEQALAVSVLSQAAHDLRRFHAATDRAGRALYLDAYSWIVANDFVWPYSFLNACASLGASPETMRLELLADASLGWFGHWTKMSAPLSRSLSDSLARLFRHDSMGKSTARNGANSASVRNATI